MGNQDKFTKALNHLITSHGSDYVVSDDDMRRLISTHLGDDSIDEFGAVLGIAARYCSDGAQRLLIDRFETQVLAIQLQIKSLSKQEWKNSWHKPADLAGQSRLPQAGFVDNVMRRVGVLALYSYLEVKLIQGEWDKDKRSKLKELLGIVQFLRKHAEARDLSEQLRSYLSSLSMRLTSREWRLWRNGLGRMTTEDLKQTTRAFNRFVDKVLNVDSQRAPFLSIESLVEEERLSLLNLRSDLLTNRQCLLSFIREALHRYKSKSLASLVVPVSANAMKAKAEEYHKAGLADWEAEMDAWDARQDKAVVSKEAKRAAVGAGKDGYAPAPVAASAPVTAPAFVATPATATAEDLPLAAGARAVASAAPSSDGVVGTGPALAANEDPDAGAAEASVFSLSFWRSRRADGYQRLELTTYSRSTYTPKG